MKEFIIDNSPIEIETSYKIIDKQLILKLSIESLKNVNDCRDYLDKKIRLNIFNVSPIQLPSIFDNDAPFYLHVQLY